MRRDPTQVLVTNGFYSVLLIIDTIPFIPTPIPQIVSFMPMAFYSVHLPKGEKYFKDVIRHQSTHGQLFQAFWFSSAVSSSEYPALDTDYSKIELLGFSCGYRIIERLTKEWTRFKDELDTMKFICTELWAAIYKKQIDNLRTNYQGTYLLQDNSFRFLNKMSTGSQYLESAGKYVVFTCGLLRGALSNLGIDAIVSTEINTMPVVKFHIQVSHPHT